MSMVAGGRTLILLLGGTSQDIDFLCGGPYDRTCQSYMDIWWEILVYFVFALVGWFFHLTLDEGIAFFVVLRYPLGVGVNLLVEQG